MCVCEHIFSKLLIHNNNNNKRLAKLKSELFSEDIVNNFSSSKLQLDYLCQANSDHTNKGHPNKDAYDFRILGIGCSLLWSAAAFLMLIFWIFKQLL